MHGSVLQNKKYIKYAYENTVEVIAMGGIESAIAAARKKGDKRADTYKAKDESGKEVEYLVSWPGLTLEDMKKLGSSKARSYNDTRGIPHVAIVNPHTLEKVDGWNGGSAGKIMDAVDELKKELKKQYGKPISRKILAKTRKEEDKVRKELDAGNLGKAFVLCAGFEKKLAKKGPAFVAMADKLKADIMTAATKKVEECEGLVARGETKAAEKELKKFIRYLKGTPLEARADELMKKINPPEA
ncbi:MAG: hypothetical protein ACYTHK_10650 [Planctomycetota bacterium]|jgi:hypothetical protein